MILKKYEYEIQKEYFDDADSLTIKQMDSILYQSRISFADSKVLYSPDNLFKIFTIELESSGVYCNSAWYSWIHFNFKEKEIIKKVEISTIDTIYKLSNNKYLVIDKSWGRPASNMALYCIGTNFISFSKDSLISHPIKYREDDYFSFCQEYNVDMNKDPYIKYDNSKKLLKYNYGNNYAYSNGLNIDTIRQGQFKFIKEQFVFEKETIKVNKRQAPNEK